MYDNEKEYVVDPKSIREYKHCYTFDWCDKDMLWLYPEQRPGRLGVGYLLADKRGLVFDLIGHCWSLREFELLIHAHELSTVYIECKDHNTFNKVLETINYMYLNNITKIELLSKWQLDKITFYKIDILKYFEQGPLFDPLKELQKDNTLKVKEIYREIPSPNYPLMAVDYNSSLHIIKSDAENYKLLDVVIPQKCSAYVVGWNKDSLYHNKSYLKNGELVYHWLKRNEYGESENLNYIKSSLISKSPYSSQDKNESYRTAITNFETFNDIVDYLTKNNLEFLK